MDLNADLGEGFGVWEVTDDLALLDLVTSANVACGYHAGDPTTMRRVTAGAVERGVAIGAHVAYRDLAGFGRRFVDVAPAALRDETLYQLGALEALAAAGGGTVAYVKPHGALYHRVAGDEAQAGAVVDAVATWRPGTAVLGLAGSTFLALAAGAGLRPVVEAFPDRGYRPDGALVARGEPGALVDDADTIAARAVRLAVDGAVADVEGADVAVAAASLCLHGDSPGSVGAARAVRAALAAAGVELAPFA